MAQSFSMVKLLNAADSLFAAVCRRGYGVSAHGAASPGGFSRAGLRAGIMGTVGEKASVMRDNSGSGAASAWAPDPATGYYKPCNHAAEIDAVDLRALLLKHSK